MELDLATWLGLALRWAHVITGICWIGASFYFIWLNDSIRPPADEEDRRAGVAGELWAVHGGGFYHKKKYSVAPDHMPEHLHWFKWEAYFTWITGFLLLTLIYYCGAHQYLIDRDKIDMPGWLASCIGVAFLAGGWVFYDALCRSKIGENNRLFGILWFVALMGAAFLFNQIFTGRGALIHVGAMIGTVMAFNVFVIIIPNQKKTVASLLAGERPDPKLGKKAGQRSLHNNYMTLPVLLIMTGNHYPALYAHEYSWLTLAGLSAAAWPLREFFNLKHKGRTDYLYIAAGVAGFIAVMLAATYFQAGPKTGSAGLVVSDADVRAIIRTHCSSCHSDTPVHTGIAAAPQGVMFDTMEEIRVNAARIKARAVDSNTMPLGNETAMSAEERAKLGAWIAAQGVK